MPTRRKGFDNGFLGGNVPDPIVRPHYSDDLLVVRGRSRFNYTHFSLAMSAGRRLARWVAWNIDGDNLFPSEIPGIEFFVDRRIGAEYQLDDSIYERNRFDRGHIARRADLLWGSLDEATRANNDSFSYANITPQMDDFNQSGKAGIWGLLELAILEHLRKTDVDQRRVSVIGGPVLADDDPLYRGILVPRQFWKLVLYRLDDNQRVRSFVLKQDPDLRSLDDFDFSTFSTYEESIESLSELVGLNFGLDQWAGDPVTRQLIKGGRVVKSVADIEW